MTDRELPLTDERIREIAELAARCALPNPSYERTMIIATAIRQALSEAQQWVSVDERLPEIPDVRAAAMSAGDGQ